MTRKELLEKAAAIVRGDRDEQYGSPEDSFGRIADLWTSYTGVKFDADDVAVMMILLKCARIATGSGKDDNWIDIAGYAACGAEIIGGE